MATELLVNIVSRDGLLPIYQAITWANYTYKQASKSISSLGTNFNEILTTLVQNLLQNLSFKKMHLKVSSAKWQLTSSPPSDVDMRQWIGSSLVQVMACRLFDAKSLPEPMLPYCQLDSSEQISVKFEWEFYHFHTRKCIWKHRLSKWRPFCSGVDGLISSSFHLQPSIFVSHNPRADSRFVPSQWETALLCNNWVQT